MSIFNFVFFFFKFIKICRREIELVDDVIQILRLMWMTKAMQSTWEPASSPALKYVFFNFNCYSSSNPSNDTRHHHQGNPVYNIVRQLGVKTHLIQDGCPMFDGAGQEADKRTDDLAADWFNAALEANKANIEQQSNADQLSLGATLRSMLEDENGAVKQPASRGTGDDDDVDGLDQDFLKRLVYW